MKIRIMTLLASAALAMPAAAVAAEVPQRGMSEARVRADFGSPSSVRGPVGSPAITRWNYDGFTVYFENGISLHTVVDRPATAAPDVVSGTQELPAIEETTAEAEQEPQAAPESTAPPMFDPVTGSFVGAETKQDAPSPARPRCHQQEPEPEGAGTGPRAGARARTGSPATSQGTAEETPEAVAEPAAACANPQRPPPADGEFRFDPVTGRIIISGEPAPKQAAAEKQQTVKQQAEDAGESVQADVKQVKTSVSDATTDAEQQAEQATADAQQKVSEAEQNVDAEVQEKTDEAEQKAEQAEEESQGGFSIDWDARR